MKEIKKLLKKYDFFSANEFEIFHIQDYGRKSKFKIKMEDKYYTLILTEERIAPYISKFEKLGDNFKEIVGFRYLSKDKKVLVLDYFGNNRGTNLVESDNYLAVENYDIQLKNILDSFHLNKQKYVDFSNNSFQSWKDYYLYEIKSKIMSIYNQNLITDEIKEILLKRLEKSSEIYINFECTFIHADVTPLNVCIDKENEILYLIDYDDFKIGDPLIDISRIINCKDMSKVFKSLVDTYYSQYEHNMNHLFYTLRIRVNWYNHIIERHQEDIYDLEKAKQEIFDTIKELVV